MAVDHATTLVTDSWIAVQMLNLLLTIMELLGKLAFGGVYVAPGGTVFGPLLIGANFSAVGGYWCVLSSL